MLGGKAPGVDKALIVNWFARDWEERLFPGAPYAAGRAGCARICEAMLDLDEAGPRVSLNGPLVEQAQATPGAHARLRTRLYAAEGGVAQRTDRGLGRLASRRPRHGAGVRERRTAPISTPSACRRSSPTTVSTSACSIT